MANEFPPTTLRIRERSRNPSFLDLTDLLGSQLIAVGFRLYDGQRRQHIVFGGKDIKRITPNFYPLKVIKRYCRLYLQKVSLSPQEGYPGYGTDSQLWSVGFSAAAMPKPRGNFPKKEAKCER